VHVAIAQAAAESVFASLGQTFAPQRQGGWVAAWIHQGEQVDPTYLAEAAFVEVLVVGW